MTRIPQWIVVIVCMLCVPGNRLIAQVDETGDTRRHDPDPHLVRQAYKRPYGRPAPTDSALPENDHQSGTSGPAIGLALSGGGARGIAHIGVLKALEKAGIRVQAISGTSIGAVIGGLYAAGYSAEEIEKIAREINWEEIFEDAPQRSSLFTGQKAQQDRHVLQVRLEGLRADLPSGWSGGQRLAQQLWRMTIRPNFLANDDFDRLSIPFRAVTTDLLTGERVVLSHGDLAEAMRASVAVPLFFSPLKKGGRWLVDGGLVDSIPVDVVRDMGADFVIAVNISSPLWSEQRLKTPLDIADQATTILMTAAKKRQLTSADFVIQPELSGYAASDFTHLNEMIQIGEQATIDQIPALLRATGRTSRTDSSLRSDASTATEIPTPRLRIVGNTLFSEEHILSNSDTPAAVLDFYVQRGYILASLKRITDKEGEQWVEVDEGRIGHIRVEGNRRTKAHVILREFPLKERAVFNLTKADRGVRNIYGTGLFDRVSLRLQRRNARDPHSDRIDVVIELSEKRYDLVRFSIRFDRDTKTEVLAEVANDNFLGLGTKLHLLTFIGERRQFYQAQHRADRIFKTYLTYDLRGYRSISKRYVYGKGGPIGEYRDTRDGGIFSIGQQLYHFGTVSGEIKEEHIHLRSLTGTGYATGIQEIRSIALRSIVDTLDRFPFPRRGRRQTFLLESAGKVFGGSESYTKILVSLESFDTFYKRNTLFFKMQWGTGDLTLPESEMFRLGGSEDLYGYHEDEFRGRQLLGVHMGYRFWIPRYYYVSVRYDWGNVWRSPENLKFSELISDLKQSWGIQASLNTLLGPVSAAYGRSEEGNERIYFSVGMRF